MSEPRVLRLQLADGDERVFNAIEIPRATRVETSGRLFGVDDFGGQIGEGVSVLLVGTQDLAAASEEPT